MKYQKIKEALQALQEGKLVLVMDDKERENEGDLICSAQFATTENVNFMATYAKGLICMPMSESLANRLMLSPNGMDTLDANLALGFQGDLREYYIGAQILRDLGIKSLHLLTNNPDKVYQLEDYGMKISSRVPIEIEANPYDSFYLKTKKDRMGHILNMEEIYMNTFEGNLVAENIKIGIVVLLEMQWEQARYI